LHSEPAFAANPIAGTGSKYGKVLAALGFVDHPRFVVKNDGNPVVQRRAMVIQFPDVWRQAASFVPPESLNIPPEPIPLKES